MCREVVDVYVYIYYVTSCYDNFIIVNKLRIKLNREKFVQAEALIILWNIYIWKNIHFV